MQEQDWEEDEETSILNLMAMDAQPPENTHYKQRASQFYQYLSSAKVVK